MNFKNFLFFLNNSKFKNTITKKLSKNITEFFGTYFIQTLVCYFAFYGENELLIKNNKCLCFKNHQKLKVKNRFTIKIKIDHLRCIAIKQLTNYKYSAVYRSQNIRISVKSGSISCSNKVG